MMTNRVCETLGIEMPILQGAMQWVSDASLVAAVSAAGGLGVLATTNRSKADIRREIEEIRSCTSKPFAVNIAMLSTTRDDIVDLAVEEGVKLVVTAAGNPAPYLPRLKEAGIRFFSVVATVRQAKKMQDLGACLVVAEGQESGGHIGEMTTMALVPQVADAIDIPLVAAGGIADGRGMAAAFALGAEGVQMGTAFLPSHECTVHAAYKQAVLRSASEDVTVSGRRVGNAVRCLKNGLTQGFEKLDEACAPQDDYVQLGTGAGYRAAREGDIEGGSALMGQIVGLVQQEDTVENIMRRVVWQYNKARLHLPAL